MVNRYVRVCAVLALIAVLCFATPHAQAGPGPGGSNAYVMGEVVVKLTTALDLPGVAAAFKLDANARDQFGSRPIFRLHILDGQDPQQKAADLLKDHRVLYAEPNVLWQSPENKHIFPWSTGGDAGAYVAQWAGTMIHLSQAFQVTRGAGVTVAVLDTGVDFSHPTLAGHLLPGYDFVDMDNNPSEVGVAGVDLGFGHGTHVTGLVAIAAPDAKILPIRVLDSNGVGNVWVLAEALHYAVDPDGNPATHDGADVINLSLSTPIHSSLLTEVLKSVICADALAEAGDSCFQTNGHGAVVVAAAGNSSSSTPEYPAGDSLRGEIAVGASTQSDALASFSNFGSWVTVAAPGDHILSTIPGGGFATWSGTSMAAPLVAGEAALVLAANPTMAPPDVVTRIATTAAKINGLVQKRVDAGAALASGASS